MVTPAANPDTPARAASTTAPAARPPTPPSPSSGQLTAPAPSRPSPNLKPVTFALPELGARQVSLSGDFNQWSTQTHPMRRQEGGRWETTIELTPGRYHYKFVVDGEWIPDPWAKENVWNDHGTLNSVIEVHD